MRSISIDTNSTRVTAPILQDPIDRAAARRFTSLKSGAKSGTRRSGGALRRWDRIATALLSVAALSALVAVYAYFARYIA